MTRCGARDVPADGRRRAIAEVPRIGMAVLAAGASRRMGACKLAVSVGTATLLGHALDVALDSEADEVVVISGAFHDVVLAEASPRGVRVVRNDRWGDGQATSVATAARYAWDRGLDVLGVMACDQPFVCAWHLDELITACRADLSARDGAPAGVVAWRACGGGRRGNPCLFARAALPALGALSGDEGARSFLRAHPSLVRDVEMHDERMFEDVDTPADLEHVRALAAAC